MICERSEWETYFRRIADVMHLKDWRIEVQNDPLEKEDAYAEVTRIFGKKHAIVSLSDSFFLATEADQRQVVAHELAHCHFTFADQIVRISVSDQIYDLYRHNREVGIDGYADAIAQFLPLPSDVLGGQSKKISPKRASKR